MYFEAPQLCLLLRSRCDFRHLEEMLLQRFGVGFDEPHSQLCKKSVSFHRDNSSSLIWHSKLRIQAITFDTYRRIQEILIEQEQQYLHSTQQF